MGFFGVAEVLPLALSFYWLFWVWKTVFLVGRSKAISRTTTVDAEMLRNIEVTLRNIEVTLRNIAQHWGNIANQLEILVFKIRIPKPKIKKIFWKAKSSKNYF